MQKEINGMKYISNDCWTNAGEELFFLQLFGKEKNPSA